VLFDCGAFPGVVYGFGRRAAELPDAVRRHYGVGDRDDAFVPLSMWIAVRCAEEGAWFGHNLASANLLLEGAARLPGLATFTKALGLLVTRARRQYGATQWASPALGLHLGLGPLRVLSAYTPAHTHAETLSYRLEVDERHLLRCLQGRSREGAPARAPDLVVDAGDEAALRALQERIEAGEAWELIHADRTASKQAQRLHLQRVSGR
jgi:hypothetical protein